VFCLVLLKRIEEAEHKQVVEVVEHNQVVVEHNQVVDHMQVVDHIRVGASNLEVAFAAWGCLEQELHW